MQEFENIAPDRALNEMDNAHKVTELLISGYEEIFEQVCARSKI